METVTRVECLDDLDLRTGPGKNEWTLLSDFCATIFGEGDERESIVVPKGFTTDLASVPRLPGMFWLFGGRARRSAVLHDWLYSNHAPRAFADAVFFAAMRDEENTFTRAVMWLGVRLGGWTHYLPDEVPAPTSPEEWRN